MRLFQVINLARDYLVLGIIDLIFIGIIYFICFWLVLLLQQKGYRSEQYICDII